MSIDWDALAKKRIVLKPIKVPTREYKTRIPRVSIDRDIVVEIFLFIKKLLNYKRFNPKEKANIEKNRQDPIILKKLHEKLEKVLK